MNNGNSRADLMLSEVRVLASRQWNPDTPAGRMARLLRDLDGHLSHGGELPEAWQTSTTFRRGDAVLIDGTVPAIVVSPASTSPANGSPIIGVRFTDPEMADSVTYRFKPHRVSLSPSSQKGV